MKKAGYGLLPGVNESNYETCAFCPELCLDRCPVVLASGNNAYSPHSKMLVGWLYLRGMLEHVEDVAEVLYQCSTCGSCTTACEHSVEVAWSLLNMRARLVSCSTVAYERSIFEEDESQWQALIAGGLVPAKYRSEEAQAVLFPGCRVWRAGGRRVAEILRFLWILGHEYVGVSVEVGRCCGYPLLAGGFVDAFREQARIVSRKLRRFRLVVVADAACYHTMKNLYPAFGIENPPKVALLAQLVSKSTVRRRGARTNMVTKKVAYHDSCVMARELGIEEEPRQALASVLQTPPIELRLNRQHTLCCGAHGGFERVSPRYAAEAAGRVLSLAEEGGADTLVTGCVGCAVHMQASNKSRVRVFDLASFLYRCIVGRMDRRAT